MNKLWVLIFSLLIGVSVSKADLGWGSEDLLAPGEIPDLDENSSGWLVQMYRLDGDPGDWPDLSTLQFWNDGTPQGGAANGVLLSSYVSELQLDWTPFGDILIFEEVYDTFTDLYNQSVYTVILDTDSWANAVIGVNRTYVMDASPHTFTASEEQVYNVSQDIGEHEWMSVIPEPSTMAFFLIGGLAFMIRRRKMRG